MEKTESSPPPLQFYLGAEDIARIVNAILPVLEKYLPNKTKDEQYVFLTRLVNKFSKDKTYGSKTELDNLVKDIANKVGTRVIVQPDSSCSPRIEGADCKWGDPTQCNSHYAVNPDIITLGVFNCNWNNNSNLCQVGNECST